MTSGVDEILGKAIELHKAGNLAEAIKAYQGIVDEAPQHAGALNLLGLARFQSGYVEEALAPLQQAVALRPDLPNADFNLALVLLALKRYAESVPHFEKAITLNPSDIDARVKLASAQMALGSNSDAAANFARALALRPDCTPAHIGLGNLALGKKEYSNAARHFRSALAVDQNLLPAYLGLAEALRALKETQEFLDVTARAVALAPDVAEARWWHGIALLDVGRFGESIEQQYRAIARRPDFAAAHFHLATAYYAINQYENAYEHFQRALALNVAPEFARPAEILSAWALQVLGRHDETDRIFDRIIASHGDDPHGLEAKKSKGMMYLNLGRFTEGWPLYHYRLGADAPDVRESQRPAWQGNRLDGTLWVWSEQGLGDQILHASMLEELNRLVSSVVLEVEPRLVTLFARSFPRVNVVAFGSDLSKFDLQAQTSIANLGCYLRPDWASFGSRQTGYLVADNARTQDLRSRLAGDGKKVVGVSWRSVNAKMGRNKTARLSDLTSILKLPGVRLVDLQYGDTKEERAILKRSTGVEMVRLPDIDNTNDIDGLAALISACDVVVTISNTTAHLSGALGLPTWVFVPYGFAQMWYWFAGKTQSPWYPKTQIRRQTKEQPWASLFSASEAEIGRALEKV